MNIRRVINIRYAQIRNLDLSNGEGIGVALFVQGCQFRCPNCFNPETWNFNGGKEWTEEIEDKFLELVTKPYIKRISILGGDPLYEENLDGVLNLINKIRLLFGHTKTIWLYTGYKILSIDSQYQKVIFDRINEDIVEQFSFKSVISINKRSDIAAMCDVIIDGRYIDSQRDITLPYRGSKNQRLINIQQSLQKGEVVLWDT